MKGLAALRASLEYTPLPESLRVNAEQRVNAIGGGKAVATWNATSVARHHIEAAAREGYWDACAGRGFSRAYDDAPSPWQRNYEIGRLWASGMKVCGITPPDWSENADRQPNAITDAVVEVGRRIGAIRPETEGIKAPRDDLPVLHVGVVMPKRRRR